MSISRRENHELKSQNKPIYRSSFINRCHRLLKMGYDRLDTQAYSESEEEDITGELTRAMRDVLQDRDAPNWAKNFWAEEEVRLQDRTRRGKRRLRIDIEIIQIQAGPRPRFCFEAKRLRDAKSRREYLGKEGLGCFLDGRYAKEDDAAGMLGYVQEESIAFQADEIRKALAKNQNKHALTGDRQWQQERFIPDLSTFRTIHRRKKPMPRITLLHTLLLFC